MTTLGVKMLGFVLPAIICVAPLKAETLSEALPICIEIAEFTSLFALAARSAGDELDIFLPSREIARMISGAVFDGAYVDRIMPLLEEGASQDKVIDELLIVEMAISNFRQLTSKMIEESLGGKGGYEEKAKFISQCAQGAFDLLD